MAKIYLNTTTTLFKGMKGGMTPVQAGLFWVTKNVKMANMYAQMRRGSTHAYRPIRRLKLLKLSRESIRRLLLTDLFTPVIKRRLRTLFGIGMTYGEQFKALRGNNSQYWRAHFSEKYGGKPEPNWTVKAGRISVTNQNYSLFSGIKRSVENMYDGIYVPEMKSPHYPNPGSFPSEYILFRPRQDLVNVTNEISLNNERAKVEARLEAINARYMARRGE